MRGKAMTKETFLDEKPHGMNYWVFSPTKRKDGLPFIVYLHGAGERGKNIQHLDRHGLAKRLCEGFEIEAVVLCPQCPADCVWDNLPHELKCLIDEIAEKYRVDKDRITITGSSMGGFGTWMLGMTYPNDFAGLAPVAGGGMEWRASNLITTPIRAYHGKRDTSVSYLHTQMMADAVRDRGGRVETVFFEELGHNDAIDHTYFHTDILSWLLSQKREQRERVFETCSGLF